MQTDKDEHVCQRSPFNANSPRTQKRIFLIHVDGLKVFMVTQDNAENMPKP